MNSPSSSAKRNARVKYIASISIRNHGFSPLGIGPLQIIPELDQMARTIEADSLLSGKKEEDIGIVSSLVNFSFSELTSRAISKDLWSILKTFLFFTVMVAQAPLTTVVYAPQHLFLPSSRPRRLALNIGRCVTRRRVVVDSLLCY